MRVENILTKSIDEFENQLSILVLKDYAPTLAIVFSDSQLSNLRLVDIFNSHNIDFIGASSGGEILNGKIDSDCVSATFFDLSRDDYKLLYQEACIESSHKTGKLLGSFALENYSNPHFISVFSPDLHGEEIIKGLEDSIGSAPSIYGGMASDITEKIEPYIFSGGEKSNSAIHTIILDGDKVEVNGFAIAGWQAIGSEHTITKAHGNTIYEINNQPALDFFITFFGFYTDPVSTNDDISSVNSQYPLQVIRQGDKVLRAPLKLNPEDKSFTMSGPVKQGEKFTFSIAADFEVINQTVEEFKSFSKKIEKPEALILFSCKARHWAFGPMIEEEIEALYDLWKVPLHGFFTFGEIGRNENNHTHFFNETCCMVALREK